MLCLAAFAAIPSFAADSFYRWTNEDGSVVISDRPPTGGIAYETVPNRESRPMSAPDDTGEAPGGGAAAKVTRPAVRNPATCELARNNLHALQSSDAVRSLDSEGNYYFLSEEQKQMQMKRAEALIRVHCMPEDATAEAR